MAHSYVQVLYQIVFCTKYRRPTLVKSGREKFYRYVWGICRNRVRLPSVPDRWDRRSHPLSNKGTPVHRDRRSYERDKGGLL